MWTLLLQRETRSDLEAFNSCHGEIEYVIYISLVLVDIFLHSPYVFDSNWQVLFRYVFEIDSSRGYIGFAQFNLMDLRFSCPGQLILRKTWSLVLYHSKTLKQDFLTRKEVRIIFYDQSKDAGTQNRDRTSIDSIPSCFKRLLCLRNLYQI